MRELTVQVAFLILISILSFSYTIFSSDGLAQEQQAMPGSDTNTFLSLNEIFNKVENSVVQITTSVPPVSILNPSQTENSTALGSGFIYDNKGHVVTNNHVVANAKIVDVTFIDGSRFTANVTGRDFYSDLAVLKIIENFTAGELPPPLALGNSSALNVGDQVVAIGNPFGLEGSMTTGIVSQTGRLLPLEEIGFSIPNTIQTDALINPGNSGGPLLNMKAQAIGVNTAGIFPGNIGFAIPSDAVSRIIPVLIATGNYSHPWLGMTGETLNSDMAEREGLDRNFTGIVVDTIVKDGPADKGGINGSIMNQYGEKQGGDIIIGVNESRISQMEDLISYLETQKTVGQNLTLIVYRDGDTIDKEVTIGKRPSPIPYLTKTPQPAP